MQHRGEARWGEILQTYVCGLSLCLTDGKFLPKKQKRLAAPWKWPIFNFFQSTRPGSACSRWSDWLGGLPIPPVKIEFAVALLLAVLLSVSICESRVGGTSHVLELSGLSEIWRLPLRLLSDNSDLLEELTKRVWGYVLLFFSEKNPCPPPSHTSCHHCSNAYSDNMRGGGG